MRYHYGYTNIEVIGAVVFVFAAMLIVAMFSNPVAKYQFEEDEVLADGVRDYMEATLELRDADPEAFWEMIYQANLVRKNIGTCSDCVDAASFLTPEYFAVVPIDQDGGYSDLQTGYYFLYEDDVLEIGALSPHGDVPIRLMWFVK